MATSIVFDLIDALVPAFRTALASSATVYDGWGDSDAAEGNYVMVGIEDADVEGAAFSADTQQAWANANYTARDEEGDITCLALSWTGNTGEAAAKACRASLKAMTSAIEDALRANPSLGLDGLLWCGYGTSTQLSQASHQVGTSAHVVFRINFRARI